MHQVVLLHHGVVHRGEHQHGLILGGFAAIVAHKVSVALLVDLNVVAGGDAVHHAHTTHIQPFLVQCLQKVPALPVIGNQADIAGFAAIVAASEHGHVHAVAAGIQFLAPAVMIKYVVTNTQQFHQYFSTPI